MKFFIFVLIFCCTQELTESQQWPVQMTSACYGLQSPFLVATCPKGQHIVVRNIYANAKPRYTNCPEETGDEFPVDPNCCVCAPEDCLMEYSGVSKMKYYTECNGQQTCTPRVSWQPIGNTCPHRNFLLRSNYMVMEFYCVNDAAIKINDSKTKESFIDQLQRNPTIQTVLLTNRSGVEVTTAKVTDTSSPGMTKVRITNVTVAESTMITSPKMMKFFPFTHTPVSTTTTTTTSTQTSIQTTEVNTQTDTFITSNIVSSPGTKTIAVTTNQPTLKNTYSTPTNVRLTLPLSPTAHSKPIRKHNFVKLSTTINPPPSQPSTISSWTKDESATMYDINSKMIESTATTAVDKVQLDNATCIVTTECHTSITINIIDVGQCPFDLILMNVKGHKWSLCDIDTPSFDTYSNVLLVYGNDTDDVEFGNPWVQFISSDHFTDVFLSCKKENLRNRSIKDCYSPKDTIVKEWEDYAIYPGLANWEIALIAVGILFILTFTSLGIWAVYNKRKQRHERNSRFSAVVSTLESQGTRDRMHQRMKTPSRPSIALRNESAGVKIETLPRNYHEACLLPTLVSATREPMRKVCRPRLPPAIHRPRFTSNTSTFNK